MIHKIKSLLLDVLTVTYGNALIFLRPKRVQQLSEEGMTLVLNKMSISDRLMRRAILRKLETKKDYNKLADLHQNYWKHKGANFFKNNEKTFVNEFLKNCIFIFDELEKEISKSPNSYHTMVEIGTGSGSVLNYLCSRFDTIEQFIGIDLSQEQIQLNKEKFGDNKKIRFVASDGFDWIREHAQGNTIFLTSRGVLEYFTEHRLQAFLQAVNRLGKTMFIAIEPNGTDHDLETNPKSQPYGYERSFSHNYAQLFKNANFELWHFSQKPLDSLAYMSFIGAKN